MEERARLYKEHVSECADGLLFPKLKWITEELSCEANLKSDCYEYPETSKFKALWLSFHENQVALQELVREKTLLPMELRYSPDSVELMIMIEAAEEISTIEYCNRCGIEIDEEFPRWRCFSCGEVTYVDCQKNWTSTLHATQG